MKKTKYCFIRISERNGEQEYTFPLVRELESRKSIEKYTDEIARNWYGGEPKKEDGGYYHIGGCVHVSVDSYREISKQDFDVLSKYL